MSDPGLIPGASILIRNGLMEEIGPARRVENLVGARLAREIDASGKIVMPAFVDAATTLIHENSPHRASANLNTVSKKVVAARVASASLQCALQGCLTVGARTPAVADLRVISKVLRAHQACQARPLRIRSVLALRFPQAYQAPALADLLSHLLHSVHDRKLATVVELDLADPNLAAAALAAAGLGFTLRFRSASPPGAAARQLALEAGAISLLAPADPAPGLSTALAAAGCVRIYPAREVVDPSPSSAANVRRAISAGTAIALASDASRGDPSPCSLFSLLNLAVTRFGLTIEEAITATTWNPACALRLAQSAGCLEAGRLADLLILDVPDYRDLALPPDPSTLSLVMRAGHIVQRH